MNTILPVLLAAAAAVGWGSSDFFGGDASSRDTPVFVVVAITEALGALVVVPFLIARGLPPPDSPRLLLAALAGLAVTCELGLIYRAISRGDTFITAPIGALGTAAAVGFGLLTGDPLTAAVLIGLLLALAGGGASAWTSPDTRRPGGGHWSTALTCAAAAAAVAVMLVSLHAAGRLDPYWATAVEHVTTSASAALAALAGSRSARPGRLPVRLRLPGRGTLPAHGDLPKLGLIALVGAGGDLAYTGASHGGALSIVSAISSLYPVATIALGRLVRDQRATRVQLAGITLALGGAVILGAVSG